ncbi:MAG TPA: TadE/TadG family type IV pilus assembly protein [Terriglobia bacterium]|nr:TadE/TadG family type IV pilus assembly protein [Terriglobia bacterium]
MQRRTDATKRVKGLGRDSSGQSLVETALIVPFLFVIILNAINFAYFFFAALNLSGAQRTGIEYSILGSETPSATALPSAGPITTNTSVSYLPVQDLADMAGVTSSGGALEIQVCTGANGTSGSGSSQTATCTQYNSSPSFTPDSDPEAPTFVLNRVDVTYTFRPLIPGAPFNLASLAFCSSASSCTFHRQVEMRAMGR